MAEERVQRRLAAILSADVAGYSRLMGADEVGTLARLQALRREIIYPAIAAHSGRMVKLMGDGALVEFASAVDAVTCADAIQQQVGAHNAAMPEDAPIQFRVGINIGDILVDGDDIYGDGVNIAARIEGLAAPGEIYLSRAAADQVRDKVPLALESRGEHTVKNIARPIEVFCVVDADAAAAPDPATAATAPPPRSSDRPSIAVLPFANMSGDAEQEYFADGIAEDIITALSKISELFVIARNSSFTFKGQHVHIQDVSQKLGARYIVEGSVRKSANRVLITAQLIDGLTGGHLWAERFDRDLTDIFAVQDEVTQEIVAALALNLTEGEAKRLTAEHTDNMEAYDTFLRGRDQWYRHTRESNRQARELFDSVIELEPNFAAAHAFLALTHMLDYVNETGATPALALERAHELAQRAVTLDDNDPRAHHALASILMWMRRHDEAIGEGERAVALDPNFVDGHMILGLILLYAGRSAEAPQHFERGLASDPYPADIYLHFQALAYFHLGRYEAAIGLLKRRLIRNPDTDISRVLLAASYGHLGREDEARAEWQAAFRVNPDYSLAHRRKVLPYKNPADFELIPDGLRKAGLVDCAVPRPVSRRLRRGVFGTASRANFSGRRFNPSQPRPRP